MAAINQSNHSADYKVKHIFSAKFDWLSANVYLYVSIFISCMPTVILLYWLILWFTNRSEMTSIKGSINQSVISFYISPRLVEQTTAFEVLDNSIGTLNVKSLVDILLAVWLNLDMHTLVLKNLCLYHSSEKSNFQSTMGANCCKVKMIRVKQGQDNYIEKGSSLLTHYCMKEVLFTKIKIHMVSTKFHLPSIKSNNVL